MTRPNLSSLLKRAHQIAKTLEGDYRARLAFGMRAAWAEAKAAAKETTMTETIPAVPALPALAGSEKQAAWAESLRAEFIATGRASIAECLRFAAAGLPRQPFSEADAREALALVDAALASNASAGWWIDWRPRNGLFGHASRIRSQAGDAVSPGAHDMLGCSERWALAAAHQVAFAAKRAAQRAA